MGYFHLSSETKAVKESDVLKGVVTQQSFALYYGDQTSCF